MHLTKDSCPTFLQHGRAIDRAIYAESTGTMSGCVRSQERERKVEILIIVTMQMKKCSQKRTFKRYSTLQISVCKNLEHILNLICFFQQINFRKVRAFSTNFTVVRHKKTVKVLLHYGKHSFVAEKQIFVTVPSTKIHLRKLCMLYIIRSFVQKRFYQEDYRYLCHCCGLLLDSQVTKDFFATEVRSE